MHRYLAFRFHYYYQYPEMSPGLEIVRDEELEHEEQQVHRQGDQHRLPGRQFTLGPDREKTKPFMPKRKNSTICKMGNVGGIFQIQLKELNIF